MAAGPRPVEAVASPVGGLSFARSTRRASAGRRRDAGARVRGKGARGGGAEGIGGRGQLRRRGGDLGRIDGLTTKNGRFRPEPRVLAASRFPRPGVLRGSRRARRPRTSPNRRFCPVWRGVRGGAAHRRRLRRLALALPRASSAPPRMPRLLCSRTPALSTPRTSRPVPAGRAFPARIARCGVPSAVVGATIAGRRKTRSRRGWPT